MTRLGVIDLPSQLKLDEGSSRYNYKDSLGYDTIAIGRLCDSRKIGSGLSDAEQLYLFNNDLASKLVDALHYIPWINELDQVRKDAILNMCFQMGAAGVAGFPKALTALRSRNYQVCASELRASLWHGQTPERSERIVQQILTGVYQ